MLFPWRCACVSERAPSRPRLVVPAGDIVRLVARRSVRGDGEGRRHHVVPAGAGRGARGLRPLLVLALQRGGRHGARARAQRYVTTRT